MSNRRFFSSGKVILSGEHSVVYGQPALVSEIDLGITAFVTEEKKKQLQKRYLKYIFESFEKKFLKKRKLTTKNLVMNISSNLPEKSGLGSSAAFAHVVLLCLLDHFEIEISKDELFKLVLEAEKYTHKNPSGVDPAAVIFGGTQVFKNTQGLFERRKLKTNGKFKFVLINSGPATESTSEMVELVKSKLNKELVIKNIGEVTNKMIKSMEDNNFDPNLITKNQRLLESLGIVGSKAKKIIKKIEEIGGNIKVTGAGGVKSGSGWLLTYHPDIKVLESFLSKNTWEYYNIEVK